MTEHSEQSFAPHAEAPQVLIYGDCEHRELTKTIWLALSNRKIEIITALSHDDILHHAKQCALMVIVTHTTDDQTHKTIRICADDPDVTANIIALTDEVDSHQRIKIMTNGYDSVLDIAMVGNADIHTVLTNRIAKGVQAQQSRVMQDEFARIKAALTASPDAMIVFDSQDRLFFASEHYKIAYPRSAPYLVPGIGRMEAFEMCSAEQNVKPGDSRYEVMKNFWKEHDGSIEFRLDDGRYWRVTAKSLPQGQGSVVTTTNITDYVRQQKKLVEKTDELARTLTREQEASAIQKQFLNMVSHEFRTPLSIIDGNAQILIRRELKAAPDSAHKRLETIRSGVARLTETMDRILSEGAMDNGQMKLVPQSLNIKNEILSLCRDYTELSASVKLHYDLQDLPERLMIDRVVFRHILGNLLSNAIKFSGSRPVIHVGAAFESGTLRLFVKDNGPGIPEKEQGLVFDRFYRAPEAKDIPGTGIGLSLVRELAALHGGKVSIENSSESGTEFSVKISCRPG